MLGQGLGVRLELVPAGCRATPRCLHPFLAPTPTLLPSLPPSLPPFHPPSLPPTLSPSLPEAPSLLPSLPLHPPCLLSASSRVLPHPRPVPLLSPAAATDRAASRPPHTRRPARAASRIPRAGPAATRLPVQDSDNKTTVRKRPSAVGGHGAARHRYHYSAHAIYRLHLSSNANSERHVCAVRILLHASIIHTVWPPSPAPPQRCQAPAPGEDHVGPADHVGPGAAEAASSDSSESASHLARCPSQGGLPAPGYASYDPSRAVGSDETTEFVRGADIHSLDRSIRATLDRLSR
jgi:hypothetical protein